MQLYECGDGRPPIRVYTAADILAGNFDPRHNPEYVRRAQERYDVGEVVEQFGSWAVTDYGLECLEREYAIEKKRLFDPDWAYHMAGKHWVDMADFMEALYAAQRYYYPKRAAKTQFADGAVKSERRKPLGQARRFRVLKRDGYKCRLCGRSAEDGVKLEIDHIQPLAKGGHNAESNLQTVCMDCNRGKGAKSL